MQYMFVAGKELIQSTVSLGFYFDSSCFQYILHASHKVRKCIWGNATMFDTDWKQHAQGFVFLKREPREFKNTQCRRIRHVLGCHENVAEILPDNNEMWLLRGIHVKMSMAFHWHWFLLPQVNLGIIKHSTVRRNTFFFFKKEYLKKFFSQPIVH